MSSSPSEKKDYQKLLKKWDRRWESLCTRCGACCGIKEGDPCEHLQELEDGRYACAIYETRFGLHKTRNGRTFECVPIRQILHQFWPGDECCGYKKHLKR